MFTEANIFRDKADFVDFDCFKFIRTLCPSFGTKFLELHTSATLMSNAPKFTSWQYIVEDFVKQVPLYMLEDNLPNKTLFTKVVIRGGFQSVQDYNSVKKILLAKAYAPVEWLLYATNQEDYISFDISSAPGMASSKINQSITVCSNRSYVMSLMDHILTRATTMMDSGAYLHWYYRHGVDQSLFDECVSTAQQVIDDYVLLYKP